MSVRARAGSSAGGGDPSGTATVSARAASSRDVHHARASACVQAPTSARTFSRSRSRICRSSGRLARQPLVPELDRAAVRREDVARVAVDRAADLALDRAVDERARAGDRDRRQDRDDDRAAAAAGPRQPRGVQPRALRAAPDVHLQGPALGHRSSPGGAGLTAAGRSIPADEAAPPRSGGGRGALPARARPQGPTRPPGPPSVAAKRSARTRSSAAKSSGFNR